MKPGDLVRDFDGYLGLVLQVIEDLNSPLESDRNLVKVLHPEGPVRVEWVKEYYLQAVQSEDPVG